MGRHPIREDTPGAGLEMRDPRRRRTSWRKQVEGYPRITVQAHALMGSQEGYRHPLQ